MSNTFQSVFFIIAMLLAITFEAHSEPPPGNPPNDTSVAFRLAKVETLIAEQQQEILDLTAANDDLAAKLACVSAASSNTALIIDGCNVHVRNGTGSTDLINGLGNLIVGYDAEGFGGSDKTGSHNLVVGDQHDYPSFGGFVAGLRNAITGEWSSVSGGSENTASGEWSSVAGGSSNTASGLMSSVGGGANNTASGLVASISGGVVNEATGTQASVSGGASNMATGQASSVSGGAGNTASGPYSSVTGGVGNEASSDWSSVNGGSDNIASGAVSSVSGGSENTASGPIANVSGGELNTAGHRRTSILGGTNQATAADDETIPAIP